MKTAGTQSRFLRAGIVGCGRIASAFDDDPKRGYVATHAGAYQKCTGAKLVAACDLDLDRLKAFGKRWNVQRLYQNFDEMLEKERLDLLSVCTWQQSHSALCEKAIEKGIKGIFCEKPITPDLGSADRLIALAKRKKVPVAVNHSRRWDTGHQKVKQFIQSGAIGELVHAHAFYSAGVANTGTHLFDLLRLFLGDAKWVQASPEPVFGEKDLTLSGQVLFQNNVLATLSGFEVKHYLLFEVDFYGTKGRLRLTHSGFDSILWTVEPSPFFSGYRELKSRARDFGLKQKNMMVNAVNDLVKCVRRGGVPLCSAEDGLKSLELSCAFVESFKKRRRIDLPLSNRKLSLI